MKTKKQKIEIEVEIPDGQELDRYEPLICQTLFGDIAFTGIAKLKPIEPPLELESENGLFTKDPLSGYVHTTENGNLEIGVENITASEARDLAKILNYWAEKGKLPECVTVKSNEASNATTIGGE